MAHSWDRLGEIASVAQLTGLDAVKLIGMIVSAANTARMHKKNCLDFAQHLKLIGNLLKLLKISELKKYPETREPLEQLEDSLRRSYILVNNCQDRSYLYLLAMGRSIVNQFCKAQSEIDRYLKLIPLIHLVNDARIRERKEVFDRDQREYSFGEEDGKVLDVILKHESTKEAASVLEKTLSRSYPNLAFCQALKQENEKLQSELQDSQSHYDVKECKIIERLIDVTEAVASVDSYPEKGSPRKNSSSSSWRTTSSVLSGDDLLPSRASQHHEEWEADLLDCCLEPSLCLKTFFFPCGTLAKITTVATNRHTSSAETCNELMAYSLLLSCCCYTCCIRGKLRKRLNITGGFIDDFLSHLMCCCCALVQEWREVKIRGAYAQEKTKVSAAPSPQFMEH